MGAARLSLLILVLATMTGGCSKSGNNNPPPMKAMFGGCPITTPGKEDFSGGGNAIPKAIYSNSPYIVYAVGVVKAPPKASNAADTPDVLSVPDQAIIRRSTDGGNVFLPFDQSTGPNNEGATNNAIVVDSSNTNIYVAQTYKNGSLSSANIHYTTDGGGTWNDVQFQLNGKNNESLLSVVLTPSGVPVFVGTSTSEDSTHKKTGFVIGLDVDKKTAVAMQVLENSEFKQIAAQGNDLFVVGTAFSGDKTSWFFEKFVGAEVKPENKWVNLSDAFPNQLDDAKDETFLNLKRFSKIYPELVPIRNAAIAAAKARSPQTPPNPILTPLSGGANAILITPDGFIFVAGTVQAPPKDNTSQVASPGRPEPDVWVVRRSANGGASFATSDLFNDGAFQALVPKALVDYENHVIAVGGSKKPQTTDKDNKASSDSHWHVRGAQDRYSPAWFTMASPKFSTDPAEESAQAVGGVITGVGDNKNLVVLGDSHEKDGLHHWRTQQTTSCYRRH